MLSKRFLASYVHSLNLQQNGDRKIAFSLDRARKEAATLTSNWGFKHIAADEEEMNHLLGTDRADLAQRTEQLRHPFRNMSFEEKKQAVSELAKFVREKMDLKDGRSSKYKAMVDSILNANASLDSWKENGNPEENGEKKLEESLRFWIGRVL